MIRICAFGLVSAFAVTPIAALALATLHDRESWWPAAILLGTGLAALMWWCVTRHAGGTPCERRAGIAALCDEDQADFDQDPR